MAPHEESSKAQICSTPPSRSGMNTEIPADIRTPESDGVEGRTDVLSFLGWLVTCIRAQ